VSKGLPEEYFVHPVCVLGIAAVKLVDGMEWVRMTTTLNADSLLRNPSFVFPYRSCEPVGISMVEGSDSETQVSYDDHPKRKPPYYL
jgi:hypothetical protein